MDSQNIDNIIKELSTKTWRKRGTWHHSVIFAEIFGDGESTVYSEKLGYPFKKTLTVWLPNGDYFDLADEWEGMKKAIEDGYKKDPGYLHKYSTDCLQKADELLTYCTEVKKLDPALFSNERLSQTYAGVAETIKRFMPFMMSLHLVDEILTERFNAALSDFIQKKSLTQADFFNYQTALTFPYRKILVLEEQENLMKIAVLMKQENRTIDDPRIQSLILDHTDRYSWINAFLFEKMPYTPGDFTTRLQELLTTPVVEEFNLKAEAEKKIKKEQVECMAAIAEFPELVSLSKEIQVFGFLRSYRVDVCFCSFVMAINVLGEIAKRLAIATLDTKYLDTVEVARALRGEAAFDYKKVIEERKKGFLSVIQKVTRLELVGDEMQRAVKAIKIPEVRNDGVIKGTVAYPGKVTARCRVLFNLDDMKKVEVGDVLVIAMTDPNYIPAMVKASAFVTDQGGILCHAAIVSREMKKPCIIGTKIATKVLKDGDMVEVDAEKGIVKIVQ